MVSRDGSRKNRLQFRENSGALNPEFALAGSTTPCPVLRLANNSRMEEPGFGRRIGAVSTETVNWPIGPGNTQAIPGYDFPSCGVYDYPSRAPAVVTGSARQRDVSGHITTDNNNVFLSFSCSGAINTALAASDDRLEYSCSDDDGAWSSVDGQYTDPTPQSVALKPMMSHSERVILAQLFSLMNCRRLTVLSLAHCHVCHH